jgi:hypothetical protein
MQNIELSCPGPGITGAGHSTAFLRFMFNVLRVAFCSVFYVTFVNLPLSK